MPEDDEATEPARGAEDDRLATGLPDAVGNTEPTAPAADVEPVAGEDEDPVRENESAGQAAGRSLVLAPILLTRVRGGL
jgi:hypothetical protein